MKKLIALLLALTLVLGLAACGTKDDAENNETNETTTAPAEDNNDATPDADNGENTPAAPEGGDIDIPVEDENNGEEEVTVPGEEDIDIPLETTPVATNGASEALTAIWNKVPEDKKFFAMGGDFNNIVDNAPGVYSLDDEGITSMLLIPEAQLANVDEAASLVHGMMQNNFTCGLFHVTGDAAAFATAMHEAIATNRWMCGMPEKMMIVTLDGNYVLACYGINDAITPFETALKEVYPSAVFNYNEAITG